MFRFAFRNLLTKKVRTLLVILSVLISASVGILAYNVASQVEDGIVAGAAYYDIIIGPSGSSTQLAMNTMFFTDEPLGTVPYSIVEDLEADSRVNKVVPISMGDSYRGRKIVGTEAGLFDDYTLGSGELFDAPFEAVVGADVAKSERLAIGDTLVTTHGLTEFGASHTAHPLTVVGILDTTNTAFDNVVFTKTETIWELHEDHEEEEEAEEEHHHEDGTVCAIMVRSTGFSAYYALSDEYGADASLLVINPATVLREVLDNVDLSRQIVYILCAVILFMNIFVISVITLLNLTDSEKEIKLMRLIGIGMRKINGIYLIQNAFIGLASTVSAFLLSRLALSLMRGYVAGMGIVLDVWHIYGAEWIIMAAVFLISVLPTVIFTRIRSSAAEIAE